MSISETIRGIFYVAIMLIAYVIASTMELNDIMSVQTAHGAELPKIAVYGDDGVIGYTYSEVRYDRNKDKWLVELFDSEGNLEEEVAELDWSSVIKFSEQTYVLVFDGRLIVESKGWEVNMDRLQHPNGIYTLTMSDMAYIESKMPMMP